MNRSAAPDSLAADLAALLARSIADQRAAATEDLVTIPGRLADLARRFVALDRRLPAAARRLAELDALGEPAAFAAAELERLAAVPGVRAVALDGSAGALDGSASALVVLTEPVTVSWRGVAYDLGTFRLRLDLAGDVRIESVERRGPRAAWDHPHVQDGLPCLGNLRAGVLKLIAEYELALAAQVLIDFLHTYQPDEAYTPIEGWPRAEESPLEPGAGAASRGSGAAHGLPPALARAGETRGHGDAGVPRNGGTQGYVEAEGPRASWPGGAGAPAGSAGAPAGSAVAPAGSAVAPAEGAGAPAGSAGAPAGSAGFPTEGEGSVGEGGR